MKLGCIITKRKTEKWPSYDLVYEWEDVIKEVLGLCFTDYKNITNKYLLAFYAKCPKWISRLFLTMVNLQFEMCAHDENLDRKAINRYNIIPWIIDCYTSTSEKILRLEHNYSSNATVLISSKEVYDYLIDNDCQLPIHHLALSLPDRYALFPSSSFSKDVDVIVCGRKNPILGEYLKRYYQKHPSITYFHNDYLNGHFLFFNQDGEIVGDSDAREHYWSMIKRAKVALYSTPGTDDDKNTNGFSQVTPRFLEFLASGVHVIARYQQNSDTEYFELDKMCHQVNSYSEFEESMDWALSHDVDMDMYSDYLAKHYTSVRVKQLCGILQSI